jgi:hypothetical protein
MTEMLTEADAAGADLVTSDRLPIALGDGEAAGGPR